MFHKLVNEHISCYLQLSGEDQNIYRFNVILTSPLQISEGFLSQFQMKVRHSMSRSLQRYIHQGEWQLLVSREGDLPKRKIHL